MYIFLLQINANMITNILGDIAMTSLSNLIQSAVKDKHLLLHPFYQEWTQGTLNLETLKDYACQYNHHVQALPRYISAAHSMCEDAGARKMLLHNLNDEENNGTPHPVLWEQFAQGVGATRADLDNASYYPQTKALVETLFKHCRSSYAEGLAALYTYEQQVPEIAAEKIRGLKEFYGVTDDRTVEFFAVHHEMDVYHRQDCEKMLDALPEADKEKAVTAARETAEALWNFLSGVHMAHQEKFGTCGTSCGCPSTMAN